MRDLERIGHAVSIAVGRALLDDGEGVGDVVVALDVGGVERVAADVDVEAAECVVAHKHRWMIERTAIRTARATGERIDGAEVIARTCERLDVSAVPGGAAVTGLLLVPGGEVATKSVVSVQ